MPPAARVVVLMGGTRTDVTAGLHYPPWQSITGRLAVLATLRPRRPRDKCPGHRRTISPLNGLNVLSPEHQSSRLQPTSRRQALDFNPGRCPSET